MELNKQRIPMGLYLSWKRILCIAAYALGGFYMIYAALQYVVPYEVPENSIYYAGMILAVISLLSLVVFVVTFPNIRAKIGRFLHKMVSYEQIFVIVFPIWYITVCLIRQRTDHLPYLSALSREIMYTGISGFILFPMARVLGKKKSFPGIEYLLHLVIVVYSCFTAIALYYACHLEDLQLPSGNEAGLTESMQIVLGTHYNMTGAVACLMVALCLYMVFSQKKWLKIFYTALAIMHLLVVFLSNSRADFVGTLFLIVATVFCYSWYSIGKKRQIPAWEKVLLCIGISGAAGLLIWQSRGPVIAGFDTLTGFSDSMRKEMLRNRAGTVGYFPTQILARLGHYQPMPLAASARKISTDLNGRTEIWSAACKVITYDRLNYLAGVTPIEIGNALVEIGGLKEELYGTHNIFLDVAAEFGVPMGAAFIFFTISIAFRSIRVLFRVKGEEFKRCFMVPIVIFTLLILNLVEGYLIAYLCIPSCVFYLFCGWIVAIDKEGGGYEKEPKRLLFLEVCSAAVFCITCVLALSFYSARYVNLSVEHFEGKGTVEEPYLIKNREELKYFRDLVNSGNDLNNVYFLQTVDIDLKNKEWMPIGIYNSENYFAGTYDGGCHCIKNLAISTKKYPYYPTFGLFGSLEGTVQNLGIESGTINGACVGSIASQSVGRKAMIFNCYNCADITGTGRAGGICDNFSTGTVVNCINTGTITSPTPANLVSYSAGLLIAPEEKGNTTVNFAGIYIPIAMEGETIQEKLNAGLEELIDKGLFKRENVRFW